MAGRPRKKTVEYFPHYGNASDTSRTLAILQNKFGNDGYAAWFKILERLALSDGHYYSCELPVDWNFLVAKLQVTPISATEILDTLAELDAIDKNLWLKKIIWCQKFVDGLSEVYRKRDQPLPKKPIIGVDIIPTTPISATENTQDQQLPETTTPISATENTQRERDSRDSRDSRDREGNPIGLIFTAYENKIGMITQLVASKIQDACSSYSTAWILEAIDLGVSNGKRNWNYIEGILRNWNNEGKNNGHKPQNIRDIPNVTNERREFEQRNKQSSTTQSRG
jgi:DnaD/phage-associated family protein